MPTQVRILPGAQNLTEQYIWDIYLKVERLERIVDTYAYMCTKGQYPYCRNWPVLGNLNNDLKFTMSVTLGFDLVRSKEDGKWYIIEVNGHNSGIDGMREALKFSKDKYLQSAYSIVTERVRKREFTEKTVIPNMKRYYDRFSPKSPRRMYYHYGYRLFEEANHNPYILEYLTYGHNPLLNKILRKYFVPYNDLGLSDNPVQELIGAIKREGKVVLKCKNATPGNDVYILKSPADIPSMSLKNYVWQKFIPSVGSELEGRRTPSCVRFLIDGTYYVYDEDFVFWPTRTFAYHRVAFEDSFDIEIVNYKEGKGARSFLLTQDEFESALRVVIYSMYEGFVNMSDNNLLIPNKEFIKNFK